MSTRQFYFDKAKVKQFIWNRDGWQCFYCGVGLGKDNVTVDHMTPLSRGGTWNKKNLVASCRDCNFSKGSLDLTEYRLISCYRRRVRWIVFPGELRRASLLAIREKPASIEGATGGAPPHALLEQP